jgi:hypothetical protein
MKTFKQLVTENESGDSLYQIKSQLAEWWKGNFNNKDIKSNTEIRKNIDTALNALDKAIDLVYENDEK